MNTFKQGLMVLADSSVIQTAATAVGAILLLIPGVHLTAGQVVPALLAVGGLAQAVEAHFAKRVIAAAAPPGP